MCFFHRRVHPSMQYSVSFPLPLTALSLPLPPIALLPSAGPFHLGSFCSAVISCGRLAVCLSHTAGSCVPDGLYVSLRGVVTPHRQSWFTPLVSPLPQATDSIRSLSLELRSTVCHIAWWYPRNFASTPVPLLDVYECTAKSDLGSTLFWLCSRALSVHRF